MVRGYWRGGIEELASEVAVVMVEDGEGEVLVGRGRGDVD